MRLATLQPPSSSEVLTLTSAGGSSHLPRPRWANGAAPGPGSSHPLRKKASAAHPPFEGQRRHFGPLGANGRALPQAAAAAGSVGGCCPSSPVRQEGTGSSPRRPAAPSAAVRGLPAWCRRGRGPARRGAEPSGAGPAAPGRGREAAGGRRHHARAAGAGAAAGGAGVGEAAAAPLPRRHGPLRHGAAGAAQLSRLPPLL